MQVTVTTANTEIASNPRAAAGAGDDTSITVRIKNQTATAVVFLEVGSAAADATGYSWATADGPITLTLEPGEVLNGKVVTAGANQVVHVLKTGRA